MSMIHNTTGAGKSPHLLILGLDGCRADCLSSDNSPFLWSYIHPSQSQCQSQCELNALENVLCSSYIQHTDTCHTLYSLDAQAGDICWSGPGWTSIFTGLHRNKHDIHGNEFNNIPGIFNGYNSLFSTVKSYKPELKTASIVNWEPLNTNILSHIDHCYSFPDQDQKVTLFDFSRFFLSFFLFLSFLFCMWRNHITWMYYMLYVVCFVRLLWLFSDC